MNNALGFVCVVVSPVPHTKYNSKSLNGPCRSPTVACKHHLSFCKTDGIILPDFTLSMWFTLSGRKAFQNGCHLSTLFRDINQLSVHKGLLLHMMTYKTCFVLLQSRQLGNRSLFHITWMSERLIIITFYGHFSGWLNSINPIITICWLAADKPLIRFTSKGHTMQTKERKN